MNGNELVKSGLTPFIYGKGGKRAIGIIYTWPGLRSTAEKEVLDRFLIAAHNLEIDLIPISSQGFRLDRDVEETPEMIDPRKLDFIVSMHYLDPKLLDCFYYHCVWNPPETPLSCVNYPEITNNYIQYDDFLIYDSGGMKNHLQSILLASPRDLQNPSCLIGSFPKSEILEPNLDNPKLFYCGVNWELVVFGNSRHKGLMNLLDQSGKAVFFGPTQPKGWGGIRPWDGFESYLGEIPFDGVSILREINKYGIVLALSSDIHRRAGAVTNRVYEACAAGAIIISDDNEFMHKHFQDSVLFINFNQKNPPDTFAQIMEKYQWIIDHKEEALAMARRAQAIFAEKFCMEVQLQNVINNHEKRKLAVASMLHAKDSHQKVQVNYIIDNHEFSECEKHKLNNVINNIRNQFYKNITLAIACDGRIVNEVESYLPDDISISVDSFSIYNMKKTKSLTDAQIFGLQCGNYVHDFITGINAEEIWFQDHITSLVRTLEENPKSHIAFSGRIRIDKEGNRIPEFFHYPYIESLMNCSGMNKGQILLKSGFKDYLPECTWSLLDGLEHYACILVSHFKHKLKPAFSKRMSFAVDENLPSQQLCQVLPRDMQTRFVQDLVKFEYQYEASLRPASSGGNLYSPFSTSIGTHKTYTRRYIYARAVYLICIKPVAEKIIPEKLLRSILEKVKTSLS